MTYDQLRVYAAQYPFGVDLGIDLGWAGISDFATAIRLAEEMEGPVRVMDLAADRSVCVVGV